MSTSLVKSLGIKGCSIWKLDENGRPGANPNADNVAISLPSIELESTTINLMGSLDIPDVTRIGNLQLSVTVPVDVKESIELAEIGKTVSWLVRWCSVEYDTNTAATTPVSYSVYATGLITSIPNAEVNAGAENTGTITMNLIYYKKSRAGETTPIFEIDRGAGVFIVNGKNLLKGYASLY